MIGVQAPRADVFETTLADVYSGTAVYLPTHAHSAIHREVPRFFYGGTLPLGGDKGGDKALTCACCRQLFTGSKYSTFPKRVLTLYALMRCLKVKSSGPQTLSAQQQYLDSSGSAFHPITIIGQQQ